MAINAASGFSNMKAISQSVYQIGQANKASHSQTLNVLETVDNKQSRAAREVIDVAMDVKSSATEAKGQIINMLA